MVVGYQTLELQEGNVKAVLEAYLMKELVREREQKFRSRSEMAPSEPVLIRAASPRDRRRLRRLAQLDSAPEPRGAMLVAEREGALVAAVPLAGGRVIADPFELTADAVSLLELRRAQLRPAG
jgi:hypothetical protein